MNFALLTRIAPAAIGLAGLLVAGAHPAGATVTLEDNYTFSAANGNTVVDTVNAANDGTLKGSATQSNGYLTPNSGYAQLPTYTFAQGASYSFVVYFDPPSSVGGVSTLFSYGNDTNNYVLGLADRFQSASSTVGNDPVGDLSISGNQSVNYSTVADNLNSINQFVSIYNGSTTTEYLNGVQTAQFNYGGLPGQISGTGVTTINGIGGDDPYGDPSFNGTIQNFQIYQGALTASQVLAAYDAGPGSNASGASVALEPAQVGMLCLMALGLGGLLLKARRRSEARLA